MLIQNITSFEDFQNYLNTYQTVIVNISATWCKPCMTIKPMLDKYMNVVNGTKSVYLKIDYTIYDEDSRFEDYFHMKKIPYFIFISNKDVKYKFVSGDFNEVSKKIFDFVAGNNDSRTLPSTLDFDMNKDF